jgi:hypothetical protein
MTDTRHAQSLEQFPDRLKVVVSAGGPDSYELAKVDSWEGA